MTDPVAAFRWAADLVVAVAPAADDLLSALQGLKAVRANLDRVERELIGAAREQAIGWSEIAIALDLGSRQAAEQRWLRLQGGPTRDPTHVRKAHHAQRVVDEGAGTELAELRRAAVHAYRQIEADHDWDSRHRRAALVRTSLSAAVSAAPSALYALCNYASSDLDAMRVIRLPATLAAAMRRLRQATGAARSAGLGPLTRNTV